MNYLTRDDIFNTARKGNKLTIDPDSLDGIVYEEVNFETGEPIYLAQFMVKSIKGKVMNSTFVEFEYSSNGLEQANKLIKRILG